MPAVLRNDKDWTRFQTALDRAALVVLGRLGHEAHPNPGRRRLVATSRVDRLEPVDDLVTLWNPAGMDFRDVAAALGIADGMIAVTGGQQVFDYFLRRFTQFDLVTVDGALLEDFKAALYKGWAQHCGVRLASVYWRGPEHVRASMSALHKELTREV